MHPSQRFRLRRIHLLPGLAFSGLLMVLQYGWIRAGLALVGHPPSWTGTLAILILLGGAYYVVWKGRRFYLRFNRPAYLYFCIVFGLTVAGTIFLAWSLPGHLLQWANLPGSAVAAWNAAGWGLSLYVVMHGFGEGIYRLRKPIVEITTPRLPPAASPLRIVQISDLHIGTHLHGKRLERYVEAVDALRPDAVVITGDLIDINPSYVHDGFPLLSGLRAPLGVYAVLGNHDFYAGAEKVEAGLARYTRIQLLRNRWVTLREGPHPVHLIGIDDPAAGWARPLGRKGFSHLLSAMEGLPERGARVLLCHRPDVAPLAEECGIDLVLSGHTHGGQFEIPWPGRSPFNLARIITPWPRGYYRIGERTHLYTNPGLGLVLAPFRFFVPREITQVILRPAQPGLGDTQSVRIRPDPRAAEEAV